MDRIFTGLTLSAALYLWAAIACAGLDLTAGSYSLRTLKLINPAMLFVVLAAARTAWSRAREEDVPPAAAERPGGVRTLALVWLLVIVPVASLAWSRALDGGFIREDFQRLPLVAAGAPWNGAVWADAGFQTYWSRQVSLALDSVCYPAFGLDPRPWHAVNLGLHLLVALATGLLALELTRSRAKSVLATALVALSPMAVEPVCWMAARDDLLAALWALCAALALVRAVRSGTGGWAWTTVSVAASLLALFSKESALSLAGALVPLAWLAARPAIPAGKDPDCPPDNSWRAEARGLIGAVCRVLPHLAVLAVYVAVRSHRLSLQGWDPGRTFTDWQKVLLLPLSPVAPLAFPVNMTQWGELAWHARAIVGLALVSTTALLLARFRALAQRETLAFYAFLLLTTVPVYRMIHLSATLQNNRYLYLPGVAWAMLVAHLMVANARFWPRARLVPVLMLGACFALVRMNSEPWVAAGAVANRLRVDLGVLVDPLARAPRVRLDGIPDQWRGAFLFNLSDVSGPLMTFHGLPDLHRFRLVELYHPDSARPDRSPGEPEFRWTTDQGLVPVLHSVMTRSLSAPSTSSALLSGTVITR